MKKYLLLMLVLTSAAMSQPKTTPVFIFPYTTVGPPSGSCFVNQVDIDKSNGNIYTCNVIGNAQTGNWIILPASATINGIQFVDGSKNSSINAAIVNAIAGLAFGATGVVVVPPGWPASDTYNACGSNVVVLDMRGNQTTLNGNCAILFNTFPLDGTSSHSFIRLSQFWPNPTTSSAPLIVFGNYGGSFVGAAGQTEESINGTTIVSGIPTNMPSNTIFVGIEGATQFQTTATGVTVADARGFTGSVSLLAGNTTNITRATAVHGQACTVAGTGTIGTCASIYGELPTAGSTFNFSGFFEGDTRFGGTPSTARIANDIFNTGAIWIRGGTSDAGLGAGTPGAIFWRTDLKAFRVWDGTTWFSGGEVISATSAAFATATTAGTCVQSTTTVTGATTAMSCTAAPVSTPGVGAVWSCFVSSAGNVTINECAVAASAGGTIAFNIRVIL